MAVRRPSEGNDTPVSEVHPKNADAPNPVRDSGNARVPPRPVQLLNADFPIEFSLEPSAKTTPVMPEQLLNDYSPIEIRFAGSSTMPSIVEQ